MKQIFLLFFVLFYSFSPALAEGNKGAFQFSFYQENYTVTPMQVEGTDITFEQVKPYIKIVFPDMRTQKAERSDTIYFVHSLITGYENLYQSGVHILANRLIQEGKWAKDDIEALKEDLKHVFRSSLMKEAIADYAAEDKSLQLHFVQVQELYLRHLAVVYIYNMLISSPEGQAAIEAYKRSLLEKPEEE